MNGEPISLCVPAAVLRETFALLRRCGAGRRECVVLWVGPAELATTVAEVIHPRHRARGGGYEIDPNWLNGFWGQLADTSRAIRAQVHTHPGRAFHSDTDNGWPIVHTEGFLSLVIPRFASDSVGFDGAYLTERDAIGGWHQVDPRSRLEVVDL